VGSASSEPFVLIDCGAWIEENLTEGRRIKNAQVAAISAGEARIYQLERARPPTLLASGAG